MEDKASIRIGIVFGMVFILLMAALITFGTTTAPKRVGAAEVSLPVLTREDVVRVQLLFILSHIIQRLWHF